MMRALIATVIAMSIASTDAVARAQDAPAPVRPSETELTFDGTGPTQTVRLVIGDGWTIGAAEVVEVTRGARRDAGWRKVFRAAIAGTPGRPLLDLSLTPPIPPGTYKVTIAIDATPPPQAGVVGLEPRSFEHTITATVEAPNLDVAAGLQIDIVDEIFGEDTVDASPLVIAERGGKVAVGGLVLTQVMPVAQDGKATRGRVAVAVDATVPAGKSRVASVEITEGFRLGTSTGTVELTAEHLDQPRTIPLTVTRRRTGAWVFVLFLVGVVAGFVVRIAAKRTLDLDEATAAARQLLPQLADLERRSRHAEAERLRKVMTALLDADGDLSRLRDAVANARTALTEVAQLHETQLGAVHAELEARAKVEVLRHLLPSVRPTIDEAVAELGRAEQAVVDGDVAAATFALERADGHLADARAQLATDVQPLADELERIGRIAPLAPANVRVSLLALVEHSKGLETLESTPDAVAALVEADKVFAAIERATRGAAVALIVFGDEARAALPRVPTIAANIVAATAVELRPGDVEANVRRLREAVVATRTRVAESVKDVAAAVAKLDEGDYASALAALAAVAPQEVLLGATGRAAGTSSAVGIAAAIVAPPLTASPRRGPRPALVAASALRASSRWRVWGARLVRGAVAVLALPLGAWWLYEASFVGTSREMIAIGATGFVTDVSFDAALDWLSKLKKAG